VSTAALQELRRHMDYFKGSGKKIIGYCPRFITLNQLYVLGGCSERYAVHEAYTESFGFQVQAEFYGGVFEKVGIEPQVQRIGEYKSFGDTYSRKTMSAAQNETLTSLLDSVSTHKLEQLARDSNNTVSYIEQQLFEGSNVIQPKDLIRFNLLDGELYTDELYSMLNQYSREIRLSKSAFGRYIASISSDKNPKQLAAQAQKTLD
jgi:protease IV